jgi:hypothetical protein
MAQRETEHATVNAEVNLVTVEQALGVAPKERAPRHYGEWTWLRVFDDDDLREFVAEMRDALLTAGHSGSSTIVEDVIDRWRITADELADPRRRRILLGLDDVRVEDFTEGVRLFREHARNRPHKHV